MVYNDAHCTAFVFKCAEFLSLRIAKNV